MLTLRDNNRNIFVGKWWKSSDVIKHLSVGQIIDIVYTPAISNYKGIESVDFYIDDIRIVKE